MKGAYLVAERPDLFPTASAALRQMPAKYSEAEHVAQLSDSNGRLFTLFGPTPDGLDSEAAVGPFTTSDGCTGPDVSAVTACPAECRHEDLFTAVVRSIQAHAEFLIWVLDGDGVFWRAFDVDPARIHL